MPRAGGVYGAPAGTKGAPNTTIESAKYNALVDDLVADANAARPVTAGGIGASSAVGGNDNLNAAGVSLASAATVNLANATGVALTITGTVGISSFGTVGAGAERILTFAAVLTIVYNATSMILPGAANITTAAGDIMTIRSLGSGNWTCVSYQRAGTPPYSSTSTETLKNKSLEDNTTFIIDEADATKKLKLQVSGISTATTRTVSVPDADGTMLLSTKQQLVAGFRNLKVTISSATQVAITADALSVEDASGNAVRLTAVNVTADITASGANGLDTGAEASNNWYYGWVCWNGTTTIGLISASASAPTLPATYTHKTLVSAFRNDASSNFWRMIQYGTRAQLTIGTNPTGIPILASGNSGSIATPTWTAVSVSAFVPPIASEIFVTPVASAPGGDGTGFMLAPNNSYGAFNNTSNPPPFSWVWSQMWGIGVFPPVNLVLESTNIYWANTSGANVKLANGGWRLSL